MLIIDGQRYVGFEYAAGIEDTAHAFGLISGPVKVLRRARFQNSAEIQLPGGMRLVVKVLFVHDNGLALFSFDPGQHPSHVDRPKGVEGP